MIKVLHFSVLACALINAYVVAIKWYDGADPTWFVWLSSIFFSIDMAIKALGDLLEVNK